MYRGSHRSKSPQNLWHFVVSWQWTHVKWYLYPYCFIHSLANGAFIHVYIFYTSIGPLSLSILLFVLIFMLWSCLSTIFYLQSLIDSAMVQSSVIDDWLSGWLLLSYWLLSTARFSNWLSTVGPIIALWSAWSSAISWHSFVSGFLSHSSLSWTHSLNHWWWCLHC